MPTYYVMGQVTLANGERGSNLRVQLMRRVAGRSTPVGSPSQTNSKGTYNIPFNYKPSPLAPKATSPFDGLYVRISSPDGKVIEEIPGKSENIQADRMMVNADVNYAVQAAAPQDYKLSGTISLDTGQLPRQFSVEAYDRDLRSESLLGVVTVDQGGTYILQYSSEAVIRAERGTADLFIKVYDSNGQLVGTSDIVFNAPSQAVIDLEIITDNSNLLPEYDAVLNTVQPLTDGLKIEALEEDSKHSDLTFLSGETGFTDNQLRRLVIGHRFWQQSDIDPPFWYVTLGLFETLAAPTIKEAFERTRRQLKSQTESDVRQALDQAFTENVISRQWEGKVDTWWTGFERYVLQTEQELGEGFAQRTVQFMGLENDERGDRLSQLLIQSGTFTPEVRHTLKVEGNFSSDEINQIDALYRLGSVARISFDEVEQLQQGLDIRHPDQVQPLAKKGVQDWMQVTQFKLGEAKLPADTDAQFQEAYALSIKQQFTREYPTTAFVGDMERSIQRGQDKGLTYSRDIQRILDSNADLELQTTSIDTYVERAPELGSNNELGLEFRAVHRVFKLAPNYEAVNVLMQNRMHSAQQIYQRGRSNFVQEYAITEGFTEQTAEVTWKAAEATYAASVSLVAELQSLRLAGDLSFIPLDVDFSNFPNWENLFQAGDRCLCYHCESVYSPAAYFADLLHFLKDRPTGNTNARDVLLARRPDLAYLELSCENANTPLPYIDVVNEVLEAAIAGDRNDQPLGIASITDDSDLPAVRTALESVPMVTGDNAYLSEVEDSNDWIWHSDDIVYLLTKKGGQYYARILRNTKTTKDILRARPQYVNPVAYEDLRDAVYPLSLPFDLYHTGSKAAFDQVKIDRWKVMEHFKGTSAPNNASDLAIAGTYFGLFSDDNIGTDDALSLVINSDVANQYKYWGVNNNTSLLSNARVVRRFLDTTGLEYNDLLKLLDLPFINPLGALYISHPSDGSCDLDKKIIMGLDVAALDRMHRFIRFWRAVQWQPWEIDMLIRHPQVGNGNLDDAFILNAFQFDRLYHQLGKHWSLEESLSLLGDLHSRTTFVELHSKRAPALYQRLFLNEALNANISPNFDLAQVTSVSPVNFQPDDLLGIQAALGIDAADLQIYLNLTKASDGTLYVINGATGELSMENLSFLYRQHRLAQHFGLSAAEWKLLTEYYDQDLGIWNDAATAREFIEQLQTLLDSGLDLEETAYILGARTDVSVAPTEDAMNNFLGTLRTGLKAVVDQYDASQYVYLQSGTEDAAQAEALLRTLLQQANRSQAEIDQIIAILKNQTGNGGVLTPEEREQVGMVLPFFNESFDALPPEVDFSTLPPELAAKIEYDADMRELYFIGFMSNAEKTALQALSTDTDYIDIIDDLDNQFLNGSTPVWRRWLVQADLTFAGPPATFYEANVVTAATKALAYWTEQGKRDLLEAQLSQSVGLPIRLVQLLATHYPPSVAPDFYDYMLDAFTTSTLPMTVANLPRAYEGTHWLHRVAILMEGADLDARLVDWLHSNATTIQVLSLYDLPVNSSAAAASMEELVKTLRIQNLNAAFSASEDLDLWQLMAATMLGMSQSDFANMVADASDWTAQDINDFIDHTDVSYPLSFQDIAVWERLDQALRLARLVHASVNDMRPFAAAAMTPQATAALEQLLLSKYGESTWTTLQKDIQDVLREQKRDALAAYLLSQPAPSDAPSEKWLNSNDLFAYYLLDVEMSACMQTSRLVQGSGSIQLFVQRALLGLEPDVTVNTEGDQGDSGWHWWQWMRKYRVWEANRKVFLYPENWAEPELRRDRSPLFKKLEQTILQQEITDDAVSTAYTGYLEGLNEVANLEIAAFFQEDRGDATILHLISRTRNADPHEYYYRRYDYRQWTAWEKIEVGITGDHLVAIVVEGLLYLYWPEFREIPDDQGNGNIPLPDADSGTNDLPQTKRLTEMRLSMTRYRNGQWSDKKVSTSYDVSDQYIGAPNWKSLEFFALDLRHADQGIGIGYRGGTGFTSFFPLRRDNELFDGYFDLTGDKGLPVLVRSKTYHYIMTTDTISSAPVNLKDVENVIPSLVLINGWAYNTLVDQNSNNLERIFGSLSALIQRTPGIYRIYAGRHFSYFDRLLDSFRIAGIADDDTLRLGHFSPFSYEDGKKVYLAFPMIGENKNDQTNYMSYVDKKAQTKDDVYQSLAAYRWLSPDPEGCILTYTPDSQADARRDVYNWWRRLANQDTVSSVSIEDFAYMVRYELPNFFKKEAAAKVAVVKPRYQFNNFYHPFAKEFTEMIYNPTLGIDALLSRENQMRVNADFDFVTRHEPTDWVYGTRNDDPEDLLPTEDVDFDPAGSYSLYNWELFYHAPVMIANSLSNNQRFEEAMHWYHHIFNPLGLEGLLPDGSLAEAPHKFWITKPFFIKNGAQYQQERIDSILNMLAGNTSTTGYTNALKKELEAQVADWRQNPFDPHRIALYRTVAYQKYVFMKYLDNLIAWGDQLFRQDSMESINEAIQLYILAAELLGPKPRVVPPAAKPKTETYRALSSDIDSFGNALVQLENYVPSLPPDLPSGQSTAPIPSLYFCIPENDKILGYWDVVADRLYKIRNCMNIDGVRRSLALFEPAIDPGALIKAAAGGMGIGAALADLNTPLPYYRFDVLVQKANAVCADVQSLGAALLVALEKKDAEGLALLRHEHETKVQETMIDINKGRIKELEYQLKALEKGKKIHELNYKFYKKKVDQGKNGWEIATLTLKGMATVAYTGSIGLQILAAVTHLFPDFSLGFSGFGGTPKGDAKTGGDSIGKSIGKTAKVLKLSGEILSKNAEMTDKMGYYKRREEKWLHSRDLADAEIGRVEAQMEATEKSIERAEKELSLQEKRFEQAEAVGEFMTDKYTNQELYQWMIGELSDLNFQRYQLAYGLAKKAERCYRFELGISDSSYIEFGHWNSLKKGLLSGEKLQHNLRRLEAAYLEDDRREMELTKHCSLLQLDPDALIQLRNTGRCSFRLPEEIFDLDYPGHYFRRIQSVSVSLPCVAGPYTTISCTLTMTANFIRTETTGATAVDYPMDETAGDARFVQSNIPTSSIATSHAQKDSGLFELSFNDPRYLPFEGAGVISDWSLELFYDGDDEERGRRLRQFDYQTISDAIIHVQYTARQAGGLLKSAAIEHLENYYGETNSTRRALFLNVGQDFASDWYQLLNPTNPASGNRMDIELDHSLFPFVDQGRDLKINAIHVLLSATETGDYYLTLSPPLPMPTLPAERMALSQVPSKGNWHYGSEDTSGNSLILTAGSPAPTWSFHLESPTNSNLAAGEAKAMFLVIEYEW